MSHEQKKLDDLAKPCSDQTTACNKFSFIVISVVCACLYWVDVIFAFFSTVLHPILFLLLLYVLVAGEVVGHSS